jgi:hypothetical protein
MILKTTAHQAAAVGDTVTVRMTGSQEEARRLDTTTGDYV